VRPTNTGPVLGAVRKVREGKTVTFVEVRLSQEAREKVSVSLAYVDQHADRTDVTGPTALTQDVGSLREMPYIPGVMPEFTQHVMLQWATGSLPYAGGAEARYEGYCRFREPAGDVEGLIGLLDAWPCPSLSLLKSPTPASTISWTAHVLHVPQSFDGWFAFASETVAGEGGFHTSVGRLHAPDGRLAAWSEQLVAVFG
jgi:acyl-CoA thioesterase